MTYYEIIGLLLIGAGTIFAIIGTFGIYYYKDFYTRASLASLIDSTGFLFITFGVIVHEGFSSVSLKVLFLIILVLLLNPLANHYIVRGAHMSGHRPGRER